MPNRRSRLLLTTFVALTAAAVAAPTPAAGAKPALPPYDGPVKGKPAKTPQPSEALRRKKKKRKKKPAAVRPYLTLENARAAIKAELEYRAATRQYFGDGSPYTWNYRYDDCFWSEGGAAHTCRAYILEDDPYECQFAGYYGRRWSADEIMVTARLEGPWTWRAIAGSYYTFKYFYCYA